MLAVAWMWSFVLVDGDLHVVLGLVLIVVAHLYSSAVFVASTLREPSCDHQGHWSLIMQAGDPKTVDVPVSGPMKAGQGPLTLLPRHARC